MIVHQEHLEKKIVHFAILASHNVDFANLAKLNVKKTVYKVILFLNNKKVNVSDVMEFVKAVNNQGSAPFALNSL